MLYIEGMQRTGLPNYEGWKAHTAKCGVKSCKKAGWYRCRGCGNGYCGHHIGHTIRFDDHRATDENRGTGTCMGCMKGTR